jgi:carbon-monoxide dehydrogenase iron sulfur subunit
MSNGLGIEVEKCTACRVCELVCSFAHEGFFSPALSRIRIVRVMDRGVNVPVACVSCTHPACVQACPSHAAYLDRTVPVVRIDEEACIGCGECVRACPMGAVWLHEEKGVAMICDLCNGEPACVANCIPGALKLVDIRDVAQCEPGVTGETRVIAEDRSRNRNHD